MRSGAQSSVTDIVERLQLYARHFEDLHAPQNVTIAMREAADEIELLWRILNLYRDAVRIDVTMEGPVFMGANRSSLKRAWDADLAALGGE